jgi:predicted XRE-type DNA-binding protein
MRAVSLKETEKRLKSDPVTRAKISAAKAELERTVALHELREGRVTQAELASVLGVSQRRVSAIESAQDIQVSTLRSYVETLGYHLELVARSDSGDQIPLHIG